jgi:hypothetical protein
MRYGRTLLLLLSGTLSCDSLVGPREESELEFVRFPADVAPLAETSAAVWAVKGQNRVLSLGYTDSSDEFMRLEIPANALLRDANGALLQPGDSVRITVQLGTDRRLLFHFEPSGLQFNPAEPARLHINYSHLYGDLDGDGSIDEEDEQLELRARIWRQEGPGDAWYPIGTMKELEADEARSDVISFTGFVIAA